MAERLTPDPFLAAADQLDPPANGDEERSLVYQHDELDKKRRKRITEILEEVGALAKRKRQSPAKARRKQAA